MSISRRILVTALIGVVPLIAVGVFAAREANVAVRDEVRRGLWSIADLDQVKVEQALAATDTRLAALMSGDVDTGAGGPDGRISALLARLGSNEDAAGEGVAGGPEDGALLRSELAALLAGVTEERADLGAISVFDRSGNLVTDTGAAGGPVPRAVAPGLARKAWVQPQVGSAFRSSDGIARYQQALPLLDGPITVGVAVVECDMAPISRLLEGDSGLGRSAEAHLVQRTGEGGAMLISELRFQPGAAFSRVLPANATDTPAIRALALAPDAEEGLRDYREKEVIAAYRQIAGTSWALIVKVDLDEAFAPAGRITRTLLAVVVGSGILLTAAAVALARSSIGRIRRLTATAEAISAGDFEQRVGDDTDDELGRLGSAFDRMATHLSDDREERAHIESELVYQARHDALTGLSDRRAAKDQLWHALGELRVGRYVGLLFCDLDSFKAVNDELGHSAGDELLRQVAIRLRSAVQPEHLLARFGGDEFVVVCADVRDPAIIDAVAAAMQIALLEPFVVAEHRIVVTMSVGSALARASDRATPESMVRDADAAMYQAKDLGRDRHVAVDDDIRLRASTGLTAVINLRRAIEEDRLVLHYQPIVDVRTGTVPAVEALVRWPGDPGGPDRMSAGALVDLAERSGLAVALDQWVLRTATTQLQQWRRARGLVDLRLAVNMSAQMVANPQLLSWFDATVGSSGVPHDRLDVEVTEMAFRDDARAIDNLAELRRRGVRVAIDDFGTGYSNLDRLHRLPVDVLKMDQAFVRDIDRNPSAGAISASILVLGHSLDLEVVAEGVERHGQLGVLAEMGCARVQGFLFAPGLPAGRIPEVVRDHFPAGPAVLAASS